jgi:hypothetical protein
MVRTKMLALSLGLFLLAASSASALPQRTAREDREINPAEKPVSARVFKKKAPFRLNSDNKCSGTITCYSNGDITITATGCSSGQLGTVVEIALDICS